MRKRLFYGFAIVLLVLSVVLVVWQGSFSMKDFPPANPSQTLIFWAMSTLIFILMVTVGWILVREFVKLYVARQANRAGSRIRTKLAVVAEDERDAGRRQVLNLGHTVGHAIEAATGYGAYRHGEAIGLGLLAALRLSGREDLRATVRELLDARGLPTSLAHAAPDDVLAALARDKKRLHGSVPFVLVREPGDVAVESCVAAEEVAAAVAELVP